MSRAQLSAENLFLRKQLALYQERQMKPRRPDPAKRVALALLSRLLDLRSMLTVVKPDTLIRWHRPGLAALPAVDVPVRPTADPR
jgi:putative transposase